MKRQQPDNVFIDVVIESKSKHPYINNVNDDAVDSTEMEIGDFEEVINEEEKLDLLETISGVIETIILDNALIFSNPDYKEVIKEQVIELMEAQFIDSPLGHLLGDNLKEIIDEIADEAFKMIHKHLCPKRSRNRTFIKKLPNIKKFTKKINILKNIPQPEQKTNEWYQFRHSKLTASNLWKVFSSEANRNQLIYEKCQAFDPNKYKHMSFEGPLHWGNKYEPLSVMFYEYHYTTKVDDFGCIIHNSLPFLAASPDGINVDVTSERYGRMLEIKNIVNREINGIPKIEYWIQMQLQMEVCDLNDCDFLETKFTEYESFDDFEKDGSFTRSENNELKGIIQCFIKDDKPLYEYAPIELSEEDYDEWQIEIFEKNQDLPWFKTIYWKLDEFSCVLVERNKLWFKQAIPVLKSFWSIIEAEKGKDVTHRAPKKREQKPTAASAHQNNKCLIDFTNIKFYDDKGEVLIKETADYLPSSESKLEPDK